MKEEEKDKRIRKELRRLRKFFSGADPTQLGIAENLIQNAAFIKVTLEELQEKMKSEGLIDIYQNGENQMGTKQSSALQAYNNLIRNYTAVIKQLSGIMPEEPQLPESGKLHALIQSIKAETNGE